MSLSLHAHTAGPIAGDVLRRADCLEVVAAYSRSFYAKDRAGNLVCFIRDGLEPGPLNLLCGNWPEAEISECIRPGETFRLTPKNTWFAANAEIDCRDVATWTPPPWTKRDAASIAAGLKQFRALPPSLIPHGSIAKIYFEPPERMGAPDVFDLESAILAETSKSIAFLDQWLRDPHRVFDPLVLSPIGLGIGLTPSGDDFIGGMLLALHALGMQDAVDCIAPHLPDYAKRHTNPISAAHLFAAAAGFGSEALHNFVNELMRGGGGMQGAVERLGKVGHSSGWDAALGVVVTLRACY